MRLKLLVLFAFLVFSILLYFAFQPINHSSYESMFFKEGRDLRGRTPNSYVAKATKAMIASEGEPATQIALDVLKKGGTAVDAAIALSFAISVYRPHSTGIGGGGFMLIYLPKKQKTIVMDMRETAPKRATRDMYLRNGKAVPALSRFGGLAVGTPGLVAGLEEIYQRHASRKIAWKDLVLPAAKLAEEGFRVYPRLAFAIQWAVEKGLLERFEETRKLLSHPDGTPLKEGDLYRNPDLSATLKLIAAEGAKGFYEGRVANAIVSTIKSNGGILGRADLSNYKWKYRDPVEGVFGTHKIYSMPPPSSGGVHIVQMLNMLLHASVRNFANPQTIHLKAEILRRAFADRAEFLGDPDFVKIPHLGLLSLDYAKKLYSEINLRRASPSTVVGHGDPDAFAGENTTHFSILDGDGVAVSSTQTINFLFGSGLVARGTGVFLNDEMDDFSAQPGVANTFGLVGGEANAVAPLKRPLSSMSPTLVTKDGKVTMVLGSPGGSNIISAVWNVIVNKLVHKMNLKDAVFAPRMHHQWLPDTLVLDKGGFSAETLQALREMGHDVSEKELFIGNVSAIFKDLESGEITGVADPRRGGLAAGF